MSGFEVRRVGAVLAVDDVTAVAAFYREVLGFEEVALFDSPGYAILALGGTRLSLAEQGHEAEDLPGYVMTVGSDGRRPSAMLVIEVDDCERALDQVRERGGRVVSEVFRPPWGGARCFVADPEGNLIEFEELA